jgi:hypothetical protein
MLTPYILIMLIVIFWCILIGLYDIPEKNQDISEKQIDMSHVCTSVAIILFNTFGIILLCYTYTSENFVLCGFYPEGTAAFSFKDGNRLCSLFLRQQGLIKKKRRFVLSCACSPLLYACSLPLNCTLPFYVCRWLASLHPELGVPFRLKRPKFLKEV